MLLNSAFYEDLADYVILNQSDLKFYLNNMLLFKSDCIIYCKTDFVKYLFNHLSLSNRNYVLITHHSDYSIDEMIDYKPACIKKWFGINLQNYDEYNISIPLGTKTPKGRAYHENQYDIEWLDANLEKLNQIKKCEDIVYCNWTITNHNRMNIINSLNVKYHRSSNLSFIEYCNDMAQYKFVISPPGNGLDNHRTWEALYLGCYPIVIKNRMYDAWKGLPILQVNDYNEITYELLNDFLSKSYSLEKITPIYWENIIRL